MRLFTEAIDRATNRERLLRLYDERAVWLDKKGFKDYVKAIK